MEYCSKTLQIIILILGVGSKNILWTPHQNILKDNGVVFEKLYHL